MGVRRSLKENKNCYLANHICGEIMDIFVGDKQISTKIGFLLGIVIVKNHIGKNHRASTPYQNHFNVAFRSMERNASAPLGW